MRDKSILVNIVKHCIRVEETIKDINEAEFYNDINAQDIVCFNIFQIGELIKNLSPEFLSNYPGVSWKRIKGMRDIIGHGYGTIRWDIVWEAAFIDVKPLHDYCSSIIEKQ